MYCRKCWYVLDGLEEHRCAERVRAGGVVHADAELRYDVRSRIKIMNPDSFSSTDVQSYRNELRPLFLSLWLVYANPTDSRMDTN